VVVQDGPGSPALYRLREAGPPDDVVVIVRDTLAAHAGNAREAAFELNAIALELPPGRASWTPSVIDYVLNGGGSA
jgi:hypothetical protein